MSLALTASQAYRANGIGSFDEFENRKRTKGLLSAALTSTDSANSIANTEVKNLMANNTYGVDKQIIVLNKDNSAAGATRSCTITGGESTSALYTLTRATAVKDLTIYPSIYGQNDVSMIEDVAKKMRDVEHALANKIEDDTYTALDTNKNTVYNSSLVGVGLDYELTADRLQVDATHAPDFFNDLKPIMMADDVDYMRGVQVIGSAALMSPVNKYINQGSGNATNLEYQFAGYDFTFSNAVTTTAGAKSTGIALPLGQMALLFQNTPDAERRAVSNDAKWYTTVLPENLLGTPVSVLEKSVCADASGLGTAPVGLEATQRIDMQFSVDYYILTPYTSVAGESPYYSFDFVA